MVDTNVSHILWNRDAKFVEEEWHIGKVACVTGHVVVVAVGEGDGAGGRRQVEDVTIGYNISSVVVIGDCPKFSRVGWFSR